MVRQMFVVQNNSTARLYSYTPCTLYCIYTYSWTFKISIYIIYIIYDVQQGKLMILSSQFFIFFVLKSCFHLNVENLFPLTDHDANDDAPHQGEEYRGEEVCEH